MSSDSELEESARREHEQRLEAIRRQIAEQAAQPSRRTGFWAGLFQFALIPAGIAGLAAGIFFLARWAFDVEEKPPYAWLQEARQAGGRARDFAVQGFGSALLKDVDIARADARLPGEIVAFYESLDPKDPVTQRVLVLALEHVGTELSVPKLAEWLARESDGGVRSQILLALGGIGSRLESARGPAAAALESCLASPESMVRSHAVSNLARLRDGRYVAEIQSLLADSDPWVRWNAAIGLAFYHKDSSGRALLAEALDRPTVERQGGGEPASSNLLVFGCLAAAKLGDDALRGAVEALRERDPMRDVRQRAGEALGSWGKL